MEMMVATVVMAMMLISLLGFIQLTSASWQRTDQQINLAAEGAALLDTLRFYMANAATMTPNLDLANPLSTATPSFTLMVATGSIASGNEYTGTITIELRRLPSNPRVLFATFTSFSPPMAGRITWTNSTGQPYYVSPSRFIGTLTEHLASLTVYRYSLNAADVYLRLESPNLGETYTTANPTPSFEIYTTLVGPNLATEPRIWRSGAKSKSSRKAYGKAK
jgi:hypothetical protein